MSRKDYQEFASIIKDVEGSARLDNAREIAAIHEIMLRSARYFKADNPNFRPVQFFMACGQSADTAGIWASRI
jgi:hypothetical protein